jgi:hypothetical protein
MRRLRQKRKACPILVPRVLSATNSAKFRESLSESAPNFEAGLFFRRPWVVPAVAVWLLDNWPLCFLLFREPQPALCYVGNGGAVPFKGDFAPMALPISRRQLPACHIKSPQSARPLIRGHEREAAASKTGAEITGRLSFSSPPTMPQSGPCDYDRKIQTEILPNFGTIISLSTT